MAGSAIHSIKDKQGRPNPQLGAEAMLQALEVYRSGDLRDVPLDRHVQALASFAEQRHLSALREALRQRYSL